MWSYIAAKGNSKHEIDKINIAHSQELENVENQFKQDMEKMQKQHSQELYSLQQTHELRLLELEKVSQLDTQTDQGLKINDLIFKAISGEISADVAIKNISTLSHFANKQQLFRSSKTIYEKIIQEKSQMILFLDTLYLRIKPHFVVFNFLFQMMLTS
ncbi:phage protein [Streptococcus pneumoniae]|nr:phage protein [Streptococcus pneumoniae]